MLPLAQYKKNLPLCNKGHSIRNIKQLTGHARKTIRHVMEIKVPPPSKTSSGPSKIDDYKNIIRENFDVEIFSATQIYNEIIKNGYDGSYSTVNRYICKLIKQKEMAVKKESRTKGKRDEKHIAWVLSLLQGKISIDEIEQLFEEKLDIKSTNNLHANYGV